MKEKLEQVKIDLINDLLENWNYDFDGVLAKNDDTLSFLSQKFEFLTDYNDHDIYSIWVKNNMLFINFPKYKKPIMEFDIVDVIFLLNNISNILATKDNKKYYYLQPEDIVFLENEELKDYSIKIPVKEYFANKNIELAKLNTTFVYTCTSGGNYDIKHDYVFNLKVKDKIINKLTNLYKKKRTWNNGMSFELDELVFYKMSYPLDIDKNDLFPENQIWDKHTIVKINKLIEQKEPVIIFIRFWENDFNNDDSNMIHDALTFKEFDELGLIDKSLRKLFE